MAIEYREQEAELRDKVVHINRVTKVGKFIRQTRIDELPQALAILRGDMSLIGPRADNAGNEKPGG